jgi:hypothetical protein
MLNIRQLKTLSYIVEDEIIENQQIDRNKKDWIEDLQYARRMTNIYKGLMKEIRKLQKNKNKK